MSLRCVLLLFILVTSVLAADQASSTKPDTSPKADPQASSQNSRPHVRFGGLMVGAGYNRFSGGYPFGYPGYWGYSPYYRYDPFLWSPFYHPGYFTGFAFQPRMGDVKIQVPDKTALVFLDGALAGRLSDLKDMWLEPGAYHLEVRDSSRRFRQKIYVLSGKRIKVTSDMMTSEALQ